MHMALKYTFSCSIYIYNTIDAISYWFDINRKKYKNDECPTIGFYQFSHKKFSKSDKTCNFESFHFNTMYN